MHSTTSPMELLQSAIEGGWTLAQPGQTIHCPSTETVRRDDRRGGPLTHFQILRHEAHADKKWERGDPPPLGERRRLRWPPNGPPCGIGPQQRTCHAYLDENGPDTHSAIRVCRIEELPAPHFDYSAVPCGATMSYRMCDTCGMRLEIMRVSAAHGC